MPTIVVPAFDSGGAPLSGLTPSWHAIFDAKTDAAYTPQPGITEIGSTGIYKFSQPTGVDIAGIIDMSASAVPRYMVLSAERQHTFAAFDGAGAPLGGLTPVWDSLIDVEGNAVSPQHAITALGSGLYKIARHTARAVGSLDLGATAAPRYLHFDTDDTLAVLETSAEASPAALALSAAQADEPLSLLFDPVTDELVVTDTLFFSSGSAGVAQALRHRLRLFKGEVFTNTSAGTDYYGKVLGTKFDEARVRGAFRVEILDTPGVTEIESLTATFDGSTRTVTVTWRVRTVYGDTIADSITI